MSVFAPDRNKIVTVTPTTRFLLRDAQKANNDRDFRQTDFVTTTPTTERPLGLLRGSNVTVTFPRGSTVTNARQKRQPPPPSIAQTAARHDEGRGKDLHAFWHCPYPKSRPPVRTRRAHGLSRRARIDLPVCHRWAIIIEAQPNRSFSSPRGCRRLYGATSGQQTIRNPATEPCARSSRVCLEAECKRIDIPARNKPPPDAGYPPKSLAGPDPKSRVPTAARIQNPTFARPPTENFPCRP